MADKEGMERKVYLLPTELVERIKAYQNSQNIGSEVEAARRLLDNALQMRDNALSILEKMKSRFGAERDLRVLTRDILSTHPLVDEIKIFPQSVLFRLRDGNYGTITDRGDITHGNTPECLEDPDVPF